jgi:phosphoribosyl 1,2-cyclic phosphodiesterase
MKYGTDVYTGADTAKACNLSGHRLNVIEPFVNVKIGAFEILPFDVQHDVPNLGFMITDSSGERLLYATDTYYLKYVFPALTYVMIECNFDGETLGKNVSSGGVHPELAKRLYKSHMSLETLVLTLGAWDLSKLRQVYLLHLSDGNSDERRMKHAVQALTGAEVYVC